MPNGVRRGGIGPAAHAVGDLGENRVGSRKLVRLDLIRLGGRFTFDASLHGQVAMTSLARRD